MRAMQCSTCKNDMSNKRINRSVIMKKKYRLGLESREKINIYREGGWWGGWVSVQ